VQQTNGKISTLESFVNSFYCTAAKKIFSEDAIWVLNA